MRRPFWGFEVEQVCSDSRTGVPTMKASCQWEWGLETLTQDRVLIVLSIQKRVSGAEDRRRHGRQVEYFYSRLTLTR